MYGESAVEFPRRVVCLTAETAEIACLLGAGDRVVGVPGTARRPEAAREKARVGGFTTFKLERIIALEPDLVLAFSDLQRDVVRDLIGAGVTVLCTNQRSFDEILETILLIGGALGCERAARDLIRDLRDEIRQVREYSASWPDRPRIYFEEWMDPMIAGIRWVSEAIEIAGGRDVFAELSDKPAAPDRIVTSEAGRREPDREPAGMDAHRGGEEQPNSRNRRRRHPVSRTVARPRGQAHSRDNSNLSNDWLASCRRSRASPDR
jgi:iron complex transport system substrate-binding protein